MCAGRAGLGALVALTLCAWTPTLHASEARDEEPVVLRGSQLPILETVDVDHIHLFRYDTSSGSFEPMPYQVDQRVATTFNPGTPLEFVETIYDIFDQDDDVLDDDDELVFRFGDGGDLAPPEAVWPEGSDGERIELELVDPRSSAPSPSRFVYVYLGDDLARADTAYVSWDPGPTGTLTTSTLQLRWEGNWQLTEFRVLAPCGTGEDLIDRVKGRARTDQGITEDEDAWSLNSSYMGGMVGPVRAIRYVRGAASAVNTIHHDIVYRGWWERVINLRVHPLAEVRLYIDLLPIAGTTFYAPTLAEGGVPIDGIPDAISTDPVPWTLTDGPAGGLAIAYDVSPSPGYSARETYYIDDQDHDDRIPSNPDYQDDDDSAYGAHGVRVTGLLDTTIEPLQLRMRTQALCSGIGDAGAGADFRATIDQPFVILVRPQSREGVPIRDVRAASDGIDVVLTWTEVAGAASYRIFRTHDAGRSPSFWAPIATTTEPWFRDVGAVAGPEPWFWSVVALDPGGGEGPW